MLRAVYKLFAGEDALVSAIESLVFTLLARDCKLGELDNWAFSVLP
jgi:hypothetical protein